MIMVNKFAEALAAGNFTQIWACTGCTYTRLYAETSHLNEDWAEIVIASWERLAAPGTNVTPGVHRHADDCVGLDREGCSCEHPDANGNACDVCGAVLVGVPFHGFLLVHGQD